MKLNLPQKLPEDSAIRETIAEVFSAQEYSRSWQDIFWRTLGDVIDRVEDLIRRAARENPALFWVSVVLLAIAVALLLFRGAYLARMRAELIARLATTRGRDGGMEDSWHAAQTYAREGRYTDAAHALYRHILKWLAANERVELHPSKTIGDYGRVLRARSSRVHAPYRDFGRTYEVVVYGHGSCDRDRYERLLKMTTAITGSDG